MNALADSHPCTMHAPAVGEGPSLRRILMGSNPKTPARVSKNVEHGSVLWSEDVQVALIGIEPAILASGQLPDHAKVREPGQ